MIFATPADRAELDLLVRELVDQAWPHRHKPGFATALAGALEAILEWKHLRELQSLAVRLRAEQDLADWKAGVRVAD